MVYWGFYKYKEAFIFFLQTQEMLKKFKDYTESEDWFYTLADFLNLGTKA